MIKVVVNATSLLSPLTGIGQYTKHLCQAYEKNSEIDVYFYYGQAWSKTIRESPVKNIDSIKKVIKGIFPNPYDLMRFVQNYFFKRQADKYQIDIYHDPNYLLYKTSTGKRVITVHDLSFARHPEIHPKDRIKIMGKKFPLALENADAIITDSHFSAQELTHFFPVDPKKIFPIYLGVEDVFHPRKSAEVTINLKRHDLNYQRYILVVGTLEPRKNLVQVLKAYQKLPLELREAYPLVIIGMKGWGTDEIDIQMEPLRKQGQLRTLGYVSDDDLPCIYAGSKIFVYPSLYEGFGLPPLEAMASGVPVITSNQASLPEVVGNAGIQVSPNDIGELTGHIQSLLTNKKQCDELINLGLEQASKFSWQKCAEQTIDVYKSVLGK